MPEPVRYHDKKADGKSQSSEASFGGGLDKTIVRRRVPARSVALAHPIGAFPTDASERSRLKHQDAGHVAREAGILHLHILGEAPGPQIKILVAHIRGIAQARESQRQEEDNPNAPGLEPF